ncbi:hypothetical protein AJ80_01735 [Polytolypa hystricis UAMH7299]|uniref:Altered inheritance of mitochondria protein 24, mitochondrial n=1 Tax=Polytolypa hystricis (strain UAMH7299) TaxID=1447883 RepID=A0A2B7YY52_POLH7|nr:hypothetical protein AJ80_01735 [Polytolypa hystricis UAMH7299]
MTHSLRRGVQPLLWRQRSLWSGPVRHLIDRRRIHVQQVPSSEPNTINGSYLPVSTPASSAASPDARFEVLGAPYSLLSVSLSASQNLYTRRGTLVGLTGKADNVVSTLRLLEPVRRALLRIPFLFQKISSTTPISALISVRSPTTSFAVVQLNGSVDWMVAQRDALFAWTGHSLIVRPKINKQLSLVHWGNSEVTGRGLLALVGKGQIYSIDLKPGEQYIAHPSNVVAYTISSNAPRPYRFKSTTLHLQVPNLGFGKWVSKSKFLQNMAETDGWKAYLRITHILRTWSRRTIWGDRASSFFTSLFLQFDGPATILVQSRASRVNDVLTTEQVNEIADTAPGVTSPAVRQVLKQDEKPSAPAESVSPPIHDENVRQSVVTVRRDGKVEFEKKSGDSK